MGAHEFSPEMLSAAAQHDLISVYPSSEVYVVTHQGHGKEGDVVVSLPSEDAEL